MLTVAKTAHLGNVNLLPNKTRTCYIKGMQRVTHKISLDHVIQFSRLMLQFQSIERAIRLPGGRPAPENDVEHSYQLAMMAWYLNGVGEFGYDTDKIIRYALIHDLPEAYAGDVHAYDVEGRKGKAERERRALELIAHEYPLAAGIVGAVQEYDQLDNPESRYVYALDKLLPMINVFLEGGSSWREYGLTAIQLHANKLEKMSVCEPVKALYEQLMLLINHNPELFNPKDA
jgi:5'-deoxynucleotidase YfbR-like HD superfamily hydrolase